MTDEFGNTSWYETWDYNAFPFSATGQDLVDWLNGNIWVSFEYHTIIWKNPLTGESIEITPDFVWEYDSTMQSSIGVCYFDVEVRCNIRQVDVNILDYNSESGGVHDMLDLTGPITVGEILERYGYTWDQVAWAECNGQYIDAFTVIEYSTSIHIEIRQDEIAEPEPEPENGFWVRYDVTTRDGENFINSVWVTEKKSIADVINGIENVPFYFDFGDGYEVLLDYTLIEDSYGKGAYFTYVEGECHITITPTYKVVVEGDFNETFYFNMHAGDTIYGIAHRLGVSFYDYFWA